MKSLSQCHKSMIVTRRTGSRLCEVEYALAGHTWRGVHGLHVSYTQTHGDCGCSSRSCCQATALMRLSLEQYNRTTYRNLPLTVSFGYLGRHQPRLMHYKPHVALRLGRTVPSGPCLGHNFDAGIAENFHPLQEISIPCGALSLWKPCSWFDVLCS
jgi:hypothetical protein